MSLEDEALALLRISILETVQKAAPEEAKERLLATLEEIAKI